MSKSKRVLGIVASPHGSGNTATLVKEVLKGAQEKGYETELICLGDMRLYPLVATDLGKPWDVTDPEDDFEPVFSSLERMDAFVFGTPIYFDHISDRAKLFIDRMVRLADPTVRSRFPKNIPAVVIITYGDRRPTLYDGVIKWIERILRYFNNIKVVATLKAAGTKQKKVSERKELLEKARQIGKSL